MNNRALWNIWTKVLRSLKTHGRAEQRTDRLNNRQTYTNLLRALRSEGHSEEGAVRLTVGGQFEAFGLVERELLIQYGLGKDDYVIDVGCGCGRLAKPLSAYLSGKYLGIDVQPDLLNYARTVVGHPDWRFEVAEGLRIPEKDNTADMVCFFSVLTHLLHEESYLYLREAKRVLKPGGKIIFSFMEFACPGHWPAFEASVTNMTAALPLNVFISRDAIVAWAMHLDLTIAAIHDGDKLFIHLPHPVTLDDGTLIKSEGTLGQSVCVLVKKS